MNLGWGFWHERGHLSFDDALEVEWKWAESLRKLRKQSSISFDCKLCSKSQLISRHQVSSIRKWTSNYPECMFRCKSETDKVICETLFPLTEMLFPCSSDIKMCLPFQSNSSTFARDGKMQNINCILWRNILNWLIKIYLESWRWEHRIY
jgi:hypothetical protein